MYELQKNVPIPQAVRTSPPARRKYPFDDMSVGDMFFVPHRSKNTLGTHVSTVSKQLGHRFVTRLTFMRPTEDGWKLCDPTDLKAVQGIGVWRTE